MDFRQTSQSGNNRPVGQQTNPDPQASHEHSDAKKSFGPGSSNRKKALAITSILSAVLVVGVVVLIASIALGFGRGNGHEQSYVQKSNYQAVFLNNGQVYFGHIGALTNDYIQLTDVFYLTGQNGAEQTTNANYSLVKLGCQQIHNPLDQMVINRAQITFWENLASDGKVVVGINQYKDQNKGKTAEQTCKDVSAETQASNTSTQGSQNASTESTKK